MDSVRFPHAERCASIPCKSLLAVWHYCRASRGPWIKNILIKKVSSRSLNLFLHRVNVE
jgi:hypothetical protein